MYYSRIKLTISETIGQSIGAFILWGFLMAFLYTLVSKINKKDKGTTHLAFIMMTSYFLSAFLDYETVTLIDWATYDVLTIGVIIVWGVLIKKPKPIAFMYLIVGLSINACLFFAMYYDIYVLEQTEVWWLWTLYAIGINVVDLLMVLVLIINKDFLGLVWVCNQVKARYMHRANALK